MTAQAPLAKMKKPLWRRLGKWTFRVTVVLIVVEIAAYAITSYWAAHAIHHEIARIQSAGEPLTFADLDALSPKVDRAQDAGPYYAAAAELVSADFELDEANHEAFFGRNAAAVSAEIMAKARQSLEQNRLALDLLDRGSALAGCNSDIQLQYGFPVAFRQMAKPRNLHNAASLRSRVLALDGLGDQAIESIISSLGLLRTMDRQPVLTDSLVQNAMLLRACGDAEFVMEKGHPSDAALRELDGTLLRLHLIQPRQMFLAERVSFLEIMPDFIAMGSRLDPADPEGERDKWSSLGITGRIMAARILPEYAGYISAASGDWPGVLSAIQKEADKPASIWGEISGPSFVKSMVAIGRGLTASRCTLIAIQIERFRLAHAGQLPDSLAQLPSAGDLPKDPFTGAALIYVKTPDGYCVFSAGRGHPEDDGRHIDREKDPVKWSERWGTHIRTASRG